LALLIDIFDRRRWFFINLLGSGLSLIALSLIDSPTPVQVMAFAALATFFTSANATMVYLYLPELFPTRLRASAAGAGGFWLRFGNGVGPLLVGFVLADYGIRGVFVGIGCAAFVAAATITIFGVETRKRVLEEVSP